MRDFIAQPEPGSARPWREARHNLQNRSPPQSHSRAGMELLMSSAPDTYREIPVILDARK